ncbi:ABC transporter permease subunit [Kitasatospora nipponensis]|uniref:ABC transporter permease subunit n=1 Tax=Kitasatospora nipponensis TaxID=258049 RepID=A0ABN1VK59_9ACTN
MASLTHTPAAGSPSPPRGGATRLRSLAAYLGAAPFLIYVGVFLLYPTLIVVLGAFQDDAGQVSTENVQALTGGVYLEAFLRSIELSATTAAIGAVLGALLTWAVSTARPDGVLRRVVTSACGVLAQFGGVTLAFAFLATFGLTGLVTEFLKDHLGIDIFSGGMWLFDMPGLMLIYTYFQIPLMVIVFLPAMDGLRAQWREAVESLGGSTWRYWRHVAAPVLAPSFLGAALLLFANAFSAYATAAALVSQGSPIVPLEIRGFLTSEVMLGQQNVGKALGLGMIVVVGVVMGLYALLQRRAARWLR